jgi:hypothetical protein
VIQLRFDRGVRPSVRAELRPLAAGFARLSRVRHRLRVYVRSAHGRIADPNGSSCGGLFWYAGPRPWVALAGGLCHRGCCNNRHVREWIGQALLHELAHYEQWRDGRIGDFAGCDEV